MNINSELDTVVAYHVGFYYSFELPEDDEPVRIVQVRLIPGAWLERTPLSETVVCTPGFRFGVPLMQALERGICWVESMSLAEDRELAAA